MSGFSAPSPTPRFRAPEPPAFGLRELAPVGLLVLQLLSATYLAGLVFLGLWVAGPAVVAGMQPVAITSGSMEPALAVGDVVLLDPPGAELAVGEVVTFRRSDGGLVTHRIVGIDGEGMLTTRGDANADPDARAVAPDDVVGIGGLAVPLAGLPAHWLAVAPSRFALWAVVTIGAAISVFRRPPPPVPAPQERLEADLVDWTWPETVVELDGGEA